MEHAGYGGTLGNMKEMYAQLPLDSQVWRRWQLPD
jgi:hypothetical protein